jgi:hypothetical protein
VLFMQNPFLFVVAGVLVIVRFRDDNELLSFLFPKKRGGRVTNNNIFFFF